MRIKEFLKWIFCGTALSRLVLMDIGSLPGRVRIPPPSHLNEIYQVSDFEREFTRHSLPKWVKRKFKDAVKAQQAGKLQEALDLYFGMDCTDKDGNRFIFAEQSIAVAYNVFLIYRAADQLEVAYRYLNRYRQLQLEAEE